MDQQIQTLQRLIDESNFTLVITGAGISVASGIPSMHGLNLEQSSHVETVVLMSKIGN